MNFQVQGAPNAGKSILWLDDDISDFVGAIDKLNARGIKVHEAKTATQAFEKLDSHEDRVCLVDLKLKTDFEGIDFIIAAHARYPQLSFIVYSQFAHLTGPFKRLASLSTSLKGRLWNLPKGSVPSVTSSNFDRYFTDTIESLIEQKRSLHSTLSRFDLLDRNPSPEISLTDYLTLPIEQRTDMTRQFRTRHATAIETLFNEGYVWIMFLGDDDKPTRTVKDRRDIPSDADIRRIAHEFGRVPFHFFSPVIADDFDSSRCSRKFEAQGYPTLRLEYNGKTFDTHFDTGLYLTRFDYDFCVELGMIDGLSFPGGGDVPMKADSATATSLIPMTAFEIDVSIVRKHSQEAYDIVLRGIAVLEWELTDFSRSCFSDCAYYDVYALPDSRMVRRRNVRMCMFRNGLLGRSLLEDNNRLEITVKHGSVDVYWDRGLLAT